MVLGIAHLVFAWAVVAAALVVIGRLSDRTTGRTPAVPALARSEGR
jgi:hypothetical protein